MSLLSQPSSWSWSSGQHHLEAALLASPDCSQGRHVCLLSGGRTLLYGGRSATLPAHVTFEWLPLRGTL